MCRGGPGGGKPSSPGAACSTVAMTLRGPSFLGDPLGLALTAAQRRLARLGVFFLVRDLWNEVWNGHAWYYLGGRQRPQIRQCGISRMRRCIIHFMPPLHIRICNGGIK